MLCFHELGLNKTKKSPSKEVLDCLSFSLFPCKNVVTSNLFIAVRTSLILLPWTEVFIELSACFELNSGKQREKVWG